MKLFENYTKQDLWALRRQVVLGSLFVSDYRNDMGIDPRWLCDFFNGYLDFMEEVALEDGEEIDHSKCLDFMDAHDNPELLLEWYLCHELADYQRVEYTPDFKADDAEDE